MLLYPLYAVLFAESGLSAAQISSLFVIWSLTAIVLEVPSGAWADAFSRRSLLMVAPVLTAAGFALWTFFPSYLSFALGFVLWGAGGSLRSGTMQALVYEELKRAGAQGAYARIIGRSEAIGTTAIMAATALAAPVFAAGGYRAVGIASVAVTLLGVVAARSLPESRAPATERAEGLRELMREGLAEVGREPSVRWALLPVVVLAAIGAMDEYIPLLAASTGAGTAAVPPLILMVDLCVAAGGWLAGRGTRWAGPALVAGAAALAGGALAGHPVGMVGVAVAYGIFQWSAAVADARLQERIGDRARATVTSMAGFGSDVGAVLVFTAYGLGSAWFGPGSLFVVAALVYTLPAVLLWRDR